MGTGYKMLCRCCPLLLTSEYVTASKATYFKTAKGGGLVFWFTATVYNIEIIYNIHILTGT